DGNLDLYITETPIGMAQKRDLLFKGHGDGTFENVTQAAGIETSNARGQCSFWIDYDNDGRMDLFVKNWGSANRLYKNNGDGTFTDVGEEAGVTPRGDTWTGVWGDYDNDGFLDLFVANAGRSGLGNANQLYHNNGDGTFTDKATQEDVALQDDTSLHKGAAW